MIWSVLECAISIITISIPAMRPLLVKRAPSIFVANVAKKLVDRISRHFQPGKLAATDATKGGGGLGHGLVTDES